MIMQRKELIEMGGTSEDIFLAWFLNLPDNANIAEAARVEIARLDETVSPCARTVRLRSLLHQATLNQPAISRHRRRQRH